MKGPRAVAWDIDGTLIDSEPLHQRSLVAACRQFGVDLTDLPDDAFRGVHVFDVWIQLRPRLPRHLARADWAGAIDDYYVAHAGEIRPMPEAVETIAALSGSRIAQVCVSNSSRRVVEANLRVLGIRGCLTHAICLDDVAEGKPNPEPYLMACRRLKIAPMDVVAVEDSVTGARSARDAGLFVVGYSPRGERFGDCDAWIDRLSRVVTLFGH